MRKMLKKLIMMLCVVSLMLMLAGAAFAAGDGQGPNVASLQPFTAEANYMSLPGCYRAGVFTETNEWITRLEAVKAVKSQGADPTLGCLDAKKLNGCRK